MRVICRVMLGLGAFLLVAGAGFAQERGQGGPKHCDMKKLEKGLWCGKCGKLVDATDLDKDKKHKAEGCGEKPKDVEICVKSCFEGCHKGPQEKSYS